VTGEQVKQLRKRVQQGEDGRFALDYRMSGQTRLGHGASNRLPSAKFVLNCANRPGQDRLERQK
jgi:hypothetical protein